MKETGSYLSRRDFLKFSAIAIGNLFLNPEGGNFIKEGNIPPHEQITFKDKFPSSTFYKVLYLPSECAYYGRRLYQVIPTFITWHWDGGITPRKEDKNRVYITYNALVGRTNNGDPVATHFAVGPNSVLQMLPISENFIIQGRLTDDRGVNEIFKAKSFGGIQIETTGSFYDINPPLLSQDNTLIRLTAVLMQKYGICFSKITGHLERSAEVNKIDPGLSYLRKTRIKLLKFLMAENKWNLVGNPNRWDFYKETKKGGIIRREVTQTKEEILNGLSNEERNLINFLFKGDGNFIFER